MRNPLSCTLCPLPISKSKPCLTQRLVLESFNGKDGIQSIMSKLAFEWNPMPAHNIKVYLHGTTLKWIAKRYYIWSLFCYLLFACSSRWYKPACATNEIQRAVPSTHIKQKSSLFWAFHWVQCFKKVTILLKLIRPKNSTSSFSRACPNLYCPILSPVHFLQEHQSQNKKSDWPQYQKFIGKVELK